MSFKCGRCGLARASNQEQNEFELISQCKCPWEFVAPTFKTKKWVSLNQNDIDALKSKFITVDEEGFHSLNVDALLKDFENNLKKLNGE